MISEIHESSRFDQLVGNGAEIVSKAMTTYNVAMDDLVAEIRDRVLPISDNSNAALWYMAANEFAKSLAEKHNTTVEIAAGILSAVSPRMPWLRNKNVADAILREYKKYDHLSALEAAKEIGMALSANVAMAVKIARGESVSELLSGTKRRSFYNNIVSPNGVDSVTVDTWMLNAYCTVSGKNKKTAELFVRANRTALGGTGSGYYAIAEAVRIVAKELRLTANAVQAIYWVSVAGGMDGGRTDVQ